MMLSVMDERIRYSALTEKIRSESFGNNRLSDLRVLQTSGDSLKNVHESGQLNE